MTKEQLIALVTRYRKSIELFVIEALRASPSSQQLEVLRDIDAGSMDIAIKSGHGTGKTALLAWASIWAGLFHVGCKIPSTAPTAPQLIKLLMPEIAHWRDRLPREFKSAIDVKADGAKFDTDSFSVARTARKEAPEGLQGFHAPFLVWIVDEASGVANTIFQVIEGSLTGERHLRIMAANPTRPDGYFYDAFHKNRALWSLHTFNAEKSENVSRASIERKRIEYGADSDAYRVRVLGEFPRTATDAIIPMHVIEDAIAREEYNRHGAEVWGVDYADAGDDRTILVKRNGNYFYEKKECPVTGTHIHLQTAAWIAVEYMQAKARGKAPAAIFVDAIGEGSGLVSALWADQYVHINVISVKGSRSATKSEIYYNKRTELYYRLKAVLEDEGRMFDDDGAVGELAAQKFVLSDTGKLKAIPKQKIKEELGRSPDVAEAMSLTCETEIPAASAEYDELMDPEYIGITAEEEDFWSW